MNKKTVFAGEDELETDEAHQVSELVSYLALILAPRLQSPTRNCTASWRYLRNTYNQNSDKQRKQKLAVTSTSRHRSNVKTHQSSPSRWEKGRIRAEYPRRARGSPGRDGNPLFIPFSGPTPPPPPPPPPAPSATSGIDEIDCGGCISSPTWGNRARGGEVGMLSSSPYPLRPIPPSLPPPLKRKGVRKHCY